MRKIYLDHAATTAMRPEVIQAMAECMESLFGNPSSTHRWGRESRNALEEARERAAAVLGAERREIVFTGGGTQADNVAVLGRWRSGHGAVVCSAIEHKAVLGAAKQAAAEGGRLILLGVDGDGRVDLGALDEALRERPTVVSVMWGNNEVGTLQPIAEIADRCASAGVPFHSDAVQAFGKARVRMDEVACDLLALSAHKFGGPRGAGVLYLRADAEVSPLSHGGGQERSLSPGTENVAGAVACALAMELAAAELTAEATRVADLRDRFEVGLRAALPDVEIHAGSVDRLPHISSFALPDTDAEALLYGLDLEGVAVSGGSACHSGSGEVSHVLTAMGQVRPGAAVARASVGHTTSVEDIDDALAVLVSVAERARTTTAARR